MSNRSPNESQSRLAAAVADSWLVTGLDSLHDELLTLGDDSRAARLADWGRRTVVDSFTYRWLTGDPDPGIVVVDLRNSYAVGPFVAALDDLLRWLDTATDDSRTVALARVLDVEFRAAPVRLLGAALALGAAGALLLLTVGGPAGVRPLAVLATLAFGGLAATRSTVSWTDLADSRGGRFVVDALELHADTADHEE
jgi:hypothetical protein